MWYLVVLEIGDKMVDLKLQFPEGFFDGETRCGYYISPEMKKVWAVELDLLSEFIRVCKKNSLRFFAEGGTMLGAVRHGGMIPWDDDIDLTMPRHDYEILCKIASKEFVQPYFWQTEETDPTSRRGHAQLRNILTTGILENERNTGLFFNQGIFIDIFPLDSIPDDFNQRKEFIEKITKAKYKSDKIASFTIGYSPAKKLWKKPIKYVVHKMFMILGVNYQPSYNEWENMVKKESLSNTRFVSKLCFLPLEDDMVWNRSFYKSTILMPFEMLEIPVPIGYENILRKFYGNWEEYVIGKSTHGDVFFDVNKPYTYYINKNDK